MQAQDVDRAGCVLRGAVLDPGPARCVRFDRDAAVVIDEAGRIAAVVRDGELPAPTVDLGEPVVLMPGLVDAHVHLPQYPVRGNAPGPLLEWLEALIFPAEASFADTDHARVVACEFDAALLRAGTTAAGVYATLHTAATRAALDALRVRGCVGKVLMDRQAPLALIEDAEPALAALGVLIAEYGARAAVVPRFAVACSPALLRGAGALARETHASIMTHLSENEDEVRAVADLFPEAASYTDVYARAGLLGPRTLLAHAIHVSDAELDQIAASGSTVVHCPTANVALDSGRMPVERLAARGVDFVLGTDVGAGPSLSMWDVMRAYLGLHAGHAEVSAEDALWRATLGGAQALGLGAEIGSLAAGKRADLAAFGFPAGTDDAEGVIRALVERSRDDREPAVVATWLDGRRVD